VKYIISFFLKTFPRKQLQLVSHYVLKILSLFYIGNQVECPVCLHQFRKFLPYGRIGRPNALCPHCLSLERHRLLWLFLKDKTEFFTTSAKMLHIAPELCYIKRFESLPKLDYLTADIESPLAKIKMDIHDIPFPENTFDVIFCNHVLEHVQDDKKALSEMLRVLKPGGWSILQIPIFKPLIDQTIEDPTLEDPKKRAELFGQDDHVRMYGKDYAERIRSTGFDVIEEHFITELAPSLVKKHALPEGEIIHRAIKPNQ